MEGPCAHCLEAGCPGANSNSLRSIREKVQDPEAEGGCQSKGGESSGDDSVECRTVVHKQHSNRGVSVFKLCQGCV